MQISVLITWQLENMLNSSFANWRGPMVTLQIRRSNQISQNNASELLTTLYFH